MWNSKRTGMSTFKQKEITAALQNFYQRPVAMVSLELLLSLFLVIFLAIFAIQPTLLTMSDLIQERKEKIELVDKLKKKTSALQSAQTSYAQAVPQLPQLDEAIPRQPQLMRSIKIIEKLATENNVIIKSLASATIPEENIAEATTTRLEQVNLPITVVISGDYLNIRSFVEDLQKSRRTYIVEKITFTLQEDRGNRNLMASITIIQPYLGVPEL